MNTIETEKVGLSSKRLNRISTAMQRYVDQGELAGMVTLVARRGEVAHFEAFGRRDIEANKPMGLDTIFRIYSMTKPITSLAVMMLYEEGHFHLGDPVANFIPAFNDLKVLAKPDLVGFGLEELRREVTIRDLLLHTAGLSYGLFDDTPIESIYREVDLMRPEITLEEMVAELVKIPLLHQPGSAWRYSIATDVLGRLVELISGQSFDVFLVERIFKPLGMDETGFYVPEEKMDRFAALYEPAGTGGIRLMHPEVSRRFNRPPRHLSRGGGLVSTASDYLRFAQMLLNKGELEGTRLVSRKTIELMTMNHLVDMLMPIQVGPRVMGGYGFGLGFRVLVNPAQAESLGSIGEYGWAGLASTYFMVDPQEELVGILMTQLIAPTAHPVRHDFRVLAYQAIVD